MASPGWPTQSFPPHLSTMSPTCSGQYSVLIPSCAAESILACASSKPKDIEQVMVVSCKCRQWAESALRLTAACMAACKRVSAAAVPERSADRELAVCHIIEPELVHHGITVVIREGSTVREEGGGQQAVTHQLLLLGIECLQCHAMCVVLLGGQYPHECWPHIACLNATYYSR